jgi:hypothetical protein
LLLFSPIGTHLTTQLASAALWRRENCGVRRQALLFIELDRQVIKFDASRPSRALSPSMRDGRFLGADFNYMVDYLMLQDLDP